MRCGLVFGNASSYLASWSFQTFTASAGTQGNLVIGCVLLAEPILGRGVRRYGPPFCSNKVQKGMIRQVGI